MAACEDGGAALEAIGEHQPDVAFLDIRMPGLTGLEVAAATAEASPATQIVFVTAYDQYAIQAFERGAVDYLLKPIARERLVATIGRLQARVGHAERAWRDARRADQGTRRGAAAPSPPRRRSCGSPRAPARRRGSSWSTTSPISGPTTSTRR